MKEDKERKNDKDKDRLKESGIAQETHAETYYFRKGAIVWNSSTSPD